MKKIWIVGCNGQMGQQLCEDYNQQEYEIIATDAEFDISDNHKVVEFAKEQQFYAIINCAGITDLKTCEQDMKKAYQVNALGARNLAIAASECQGKLVHLSSQFVFDGKSLYPYKEFDDTHPLTTFGKTKLSAEKYVRQFCHRHYVIRSTWVYGHDNDFIAQIINQGKEHQVIEASSDRFGSPTSAKELSKFIYYLLNSTIYGTYHATCTGVCSRFEFAREIIALTNLNTKIKAVPTQLSLYCHQDVPSAVLDNYILSLEETYKFQDWKIALKEYIESKEI